eukprot:6076211-Pyramimonas_sp.AAC.2
MQDCRALRGATPKASTAAVATPELMAAWWSDGGVSQGTWGSSLRPRLKTGTFSGPLEASKPKRLCDAMRRVSEACHLNGMVMGMRSVKSFARSKHCVASDARARLAIQEHLWM